MMKIRYYLKNNKSIGSGGFTLIELMISVVLAAFITAGAYAMYDSQQYSHFVQEQVVQMQQNQRSAFTILANGIRSAGYDPLASGCAEIKSADLDLIRFTRDSDASGYCSESEEDMQYELYVDTDGVKKLGQTDRYSDGDRNIQPIAENIEELEFEYFDKDGNKTTIEKNVISVRITILARSAKRDWQMVQVPSYTAPSGTVWGNYDDHYRRLLLSTTVQCRNIFIREQM